jgi:hypothetical protein
VFTAPLFSTLGDNPGGLAADFSTGASARDFLSQLVIYMIFYLGEHFQPVLEFFTQSTNRIPHKLG